MFGTNLSREIKMFYMIEKIRPFYDRPRAVVKMKLDVKNTMEHIALAFVQVIYNAVLTVPPPLGFGTRMFG